ncbi:MAG: hypothetical protein ACM3H8_04555 [Sphingobacteriales bacterium]
MKKMTLIFSVLIIATVIYSCSKGGYTAPGGGGTTGGGGGGGTTTDCSIINAKFAADIAPIISSNCAKAGCHDGSVASIPKLTTYAEIAANAASINSQVQAGTMPKAPNSPLNATQKAQINCWVTSGAANN